MGWGNKHAGSSRGLTTCTMKPCGGLYSTSPQIMYMGLHAAANTLGPSSICPHIPFLQTPITFVFLVAAASALDGIDVPAVVNHVTQPTVQLLVCACMQLPVSVAQAVIDFLTTIPTATKSFGLQGFLLQTCLLFIQALPKSMQPGIKVSLLFSHGFTWTGLLSQL